MSRQVVRNSDEMFKAKYLMRRSWWTDEGGKNRYAQEKGNQKEQEIKFWTKIEEKKITEILI